MCESFCNAPVDVNQFLPSYESLNTSIYMVQAGFQDYFFPLHNMKTTTKLLLRNMPEIVSAISDLLKVSFTCNTIPQKITPKECLPLQYSQTLVAFCYLQDLAEFGAGNSRAHLSWDRIHPSQAANRAAAAAFFSGKHITPGDFGCVANTSQWDSSF